MELHMEFSFWLKGLEEFLRDPNSFLLSSLKCIVTGRKESCPSDI